MSDKKYPIAEIFTSPQGEGVYTGTSMTFIRLAGCTVGRKFPKAKYEDTFKTIYHERDSMSDRQERVPGLPIYTEQCTLYDGRTFACDTDYRMKGRMDVENIFAHVPAGVEHVCISGGEPFMHDLTELVRYALNRWMVHVETSGTIPLDKALPGWPLSKQNLWITVSPKFGVLPEMIVRANEIKLLVDEKFDIGTVPVEVIGHEAVFIQPVNYENEVNRENLKRVMELQKQHPNWRVSLQLHKVLSDYIGERVR